MTERLSKSVADDLLGRIARGEYKPGDRLPSEQLLMAEYGVGRNTIREAMQSLRTLDLVEIRPRLGARVLDIGANPFGSSAVSVLIRGQTIRELYEVRLILEPAAAAMAASNRTDQDLLAIRRARTHFRVAYETGTPVWEADIEFHQAIAQASGNTVLARILTPISDLLNHAREATGRITAAVERALHEHEHIAAAIEARAPARARRAMTTHMQSALWAIDQVKDLDTPPGEQAPADETSNARTSSVALENAPNAVTLRRRRSNGDGLNDVPADAANEVR